MSDRVAALTLLVQESPVHRTAHLDQLLAMAAKQSRRESMPVLLALQDLFVSDLLPDRKLLFFRESTLRQPPDVEQEALFQFEHALKLAYASYINLPPLYFCNIWSGTRPTSNHWRLLCMTPWCT